MNKMKFYLILLCFVMLFTAAANNTEKAGEKPAAGLANPWTETDADGLMQTLGLEFNVPEDAEDVTYRMLESEKMAEMQFTLYDMPFVARIKPAALEPEDISGMHYKWEFEEESKEGRFWEKNLKAKDGKNTVEVYLWFDIVPGLMYSISVKAPDLDGFDLKAVAMMTWVDVQGDN